VAARAADCCEDAVGVKEKCGCIDHQTVVSIDSPSPSHPQPLLADPPRRPYDSGNASEAIDVAVVEKIPGLEQGRKNYT
jgi:hypothetical protein